MVIKNFVFFFLAPLCIAFGLQLAGDIGTQDSIAYWSAVQAFVAGENPYEPNILLQYQLTVHPNLKTSQLFLNPPWTIPLLLPLFYWDFATSSLLLLSSNISITFFALRRLSELGAPIAPRYVVLVGAFFPILSCWYFGQLSCFLLLGAILSLEWIIQSYQPWWKLAVALLLFSIKPQTPFILSVALMVTAVRRGSWTDTCKVALFAVGPVLFLTYHAELLEWWVSSFVHSAKWATSSLPSLVSTFLSSVNRPSLLMLPAALTTAFVLVLERGLMTPYRFICYVIISALLAPYAWVFDFSPFVIITYAVSVVGIQQQPYLLKRRAYIAALVVLCLPFEALLTDNLQAYALHPLIVVALFWFIRHSINDVFSTSALSTGTFTSMR